MQKNKIFVNSILNSIKTVSTIVFPIITFPYISRVLLPEGVGRINFSIAFVSYFALIASLGVSTYAIRECAKVASNRNALSKTASEIYSINVLSTVIAYILLFFTICFCENISSYKSLIIIQSSVLLFTTIGAEWLNNAMEDFYFITVRSVVFQFFSLFLIFIFVKNSDDCYKFMLISVVSSCGSCITNIFYRKKFCQVRFTLKLNLNVHFKPIFFLFAMMISQVVLLNTDITMIGIMKNDFEVGIYSTASKIVCIISSVVSSLVWVVIPSMSIYFNERNYDKINELLEKIFSVLLFLGIPAIVGIITLADEVVFICAGESYSKAALPLTIMMFTFLFSLVGGNFLGNMVLLPSGREKTYMLICSLAAAFNVVLNYFFIPYGGAMAAALTTLISSIIILILLIICKDRNIKIDYFFKRLRDPVFGAFIVLSICILLKNVILDIYIRTFLCITISTFAYCIIMKLLKNGVYIQVMNTLLSKINK